MNLSRRRVLTGLIAAPAIIMTPGLLMPVRSVITASNFMFIDLESDRGLVEIIAKLYGLTRKQQENDVSLRGRILDVMLPSKATHLFLEGTMI